MSTKRFINKKHFISTLLHDKIHNEVFDIQLKQTQPSLFNINFVDKTSDAEVTQGRLAVHLTSDYKTIYAHLELADKVFIFKEEVDILPLPILIIEAENFYYTLHNLIAISNVADNFLLSYG
jgi:hypothetical protein